MNQYYKSSDYYPDDKDIYDYLTATGASHPAMSDFLADYGIFTSVRNNREQVQDYLSYLYLSWPKAFDLLELVGTRATDEHLTSSEIDVTTDIDRVRSAIEEVKKARAKPHRESYELQFSQDQTEVDVSVSYIELDTSKTRVLQKRQRDINIHIRITASKLFVSHTNENPIAIAIVQNFLGTLASRDAANVDKFIPKYITFDKITSPSVRVQFFKDMMSQVKNSELKDVTNVKVGRIKRDAKLADTQEKTTEADENFAANISKVTFQGTQLFQTKEFQNLVTKGFFITSATWRAEMTESPLDQIEFSAGFTDTDTCKLFGFKVAGRYSFVDGILQSKKDRIPGPSVKVLTKLLEDAGRSAYEIAIAKSTSAK